MHLVVLLHIEIDGAVALVGKAIVNNLPHQLLLFNDVSRSMRFYAGWQAIQCSHRLMEAVRVVLSYFHRFQLFQSRLLGNFVLSLVCIMLQVPYIGDVTHIAYLIADMAEKTENDVKCDCGTCVSQVSVTIYCRSADIHAHVWRMQWAEHLFLSGQGVVNIKCLFHSCFCLLLKKQHKGTNNSAKKMKRKPFSFPNVRILYNQCKKTK